LAIDRDVLIRHHDEAAMVAFRWAAGVLGRQHGDQMKVLFAVDCVTGGPARLRFGEMRGHWGRRPELNRNPARDHAEARIALADAQCVQRPVGQTGGGGETVALHGGEYAFARDRAGRDAGELSALWHMRNFVRRYARRRIADPAPPVPGAAGAGACEKALVEETVLRVGRRRPDCRGRRLLT
jgi:hypothetical protein